MPNKRRYTKPVKYSIVDSTDLAKSETSLAKHLTGFIEKREKVQRLSFEEDPSFSNQYYSVYVPKQNLIPDVALKAISRQDGLISSIITARANQLKAYGHPVKNRFSFGYKISIKPSVEMTLTEEQKESLNKRITQIARKLYNCGETKGLKDIEYMNLAEFLFRTARDALVVGRFAVEILNVPDMETGEKKFHSFRPVDAGTIYKAAYLDQQAAESVRREGLSLLQQLKNKKIDPDKFKNEEYSWFQVINNVPKQAFTSEELVVHNCYPTNYVELYGYPLTPIDTVISEVITHINIVNHNKLYFQSGRATRGMIIIKSADVDEGVLENIRQQFNASINSVTNSWRMPVFSVGPEDNIDWKAIDTGARDMEFQFLSDNNARNIMAAFQVSPDELPGYSHLSKGTANQALSESSNEYKLEAARDVGIRPFLSHFEDFLNTRILPLFDLEVAEKCYLELVGLDQDSPEKEATRLLQDSSIHMSYNQILGKVEKPPIPKELGGDFPFNTQYQQFVQLYVPFGEIVEYWFNKPGASKDPALQFYQNPFWFQHRQMNEAEKMNEHQMQMQQQQQQMAMEQQGHQQEMDKQQVTQQGQQDQSQDQAQPKGGDLKIDPRSIQVPDVTSGVNQLLQMLGKSEKQLTPDKQKLLIHQKLILKKITDLWDDESKKVLYEIANAVSKDINEK